MSTILPYRGPADLIISYGEVMVSLQSSAAPELVPISKANSFF